MSPATYRRSREIYFTEKTRPVALPATGLKAWPITYRALDPHYTRAEGEVGIPGEPGPFAPPRTRPYPLPPLPVKSSGVLFERGARALGLHPQPAPLAILSQPFHGRPACQHCGYCLGFGCEFRAKSSTLYTVIPIAEATGRCEVRPNSYVRRIEVDKQGRVTGATYFDENKKEQFQRARAVVLCCNGSETPRLLLLSASSRFPSGLANSSGVVGKYLMFNGYSSASGVFERPLNEVKSVTATRVLYDFYESDPKRGFYGGGGPARAPFAYPPIFPFGGLPPAPPPGAPGYKP